MSEQSSIELLQKLQDRFKKHQQRHMDIQWAQVKNRLETRPDKLSALQAMENSGGEPDVVAFDINTGEYIFCDCSAESPAGRRSLCYDRAALESRKEHQPADTVIDMAHAMGVELLDEAQYRALQQLGEFDRKTSSWIRTPDRIRELGGALFGDRRYEQVFVYHNGAQSYYAARGFRVSLRV